jgi:rhamnulokinase/L-fuculokinase
VTKQWDFDLIKRLGFPENWFLPITRPAAVLGEITYLPGVNVVTVAGHDTASAVIGIPSENTVFVCCGTWCLVGTELNEPILTKQSAEANITNELGYGGKIRYLKNITGFWLITQAKKYYGENGTDFTYAEIDEMASGAEANKYIINPDAPVFAEYGNMPKKIAEYCAGAEQGTPRTEAEIFRCIYDSLALRIGAVIKEIETNCGKIFENIHVAGGGAQSRLLCRILTEITGKRVQTGRAEASSYGNAYAQFALHGLL